VQPELVTGDAS